MGVDVACGGDHQHAAELLTRGVASSDLGYYTLAVSLLGEAMSALHSAIPDNAADLKFSDCSVEHDRLSARILLSLSYPTHELGQRARSIRLLANAERLARRRSLGQLTVVTRAQHGVLLLREGRLADAIRQLDRAVQLIDDAEPEDQCKIIISRGEAHHQLGNIQSAIADFSHALDLSRRYGFTELEFAARHNLGYMHYLAGNLPRSLELMPTVEQAVSDHYKGVVGIDRARVLLSAGLVADADRTLLEASAALERTEMLPLLAEAELTRADVALLAGNCALAQEVSRTAVSRLRQRGNPRAVALAELAVLRADAEAGKRADKLVRAADRLAATLSRLGLRDQAKLARLIAIEYSGPSPRGKPRALPAISAGQSLDLRLYGHLVRTKLAFARGNRRAAERQARAGMAELMKHQAQFGSLDLQTSSAAHGVSLAALAITEEIGAGEPVAVLAWLERARAISSRITPVRPPEDKITADLLTQLRWVMSQLEHEEVESENLESLRKRRQALQREIRGRSWTVQGTGSVDQVPGTTEMRASLDDAALVTTFGIDDEIHGIVLTGRGCWMQRLTTMAEAERLVQRITADLDALALGHVPEPVRTSARNSLTRGLRTLDELLVRPLTLPDAPIVLVPPGRLATLPWGELPSLKGRPLTIAPSAAAWLGAHARFQRKSGPVVAVAGPGLGRADQEVASVAQSWPGCQTLTGAQATGEAFLSAINRAGLVHVAAHGRHERESPLFSSIRLVDGPVVGYDLDRVSQPPQQVVLSACELGQATVRLGDEALGLTRALLHNGTSTIISGVAKVSDAGAADLMVDYHRRLAAGAAPAYALAEAVEAAAEPIPFACFGAGW
ncbi:MAG TPA: CHAT domain-containing tetratricopeptide repeat protein [Propionibacteriaceae bacterium]|nr:CHAT domain-containing tetratricopeptide repeat protein [Propionibacteriaceae bacterium]